MWLREINNNGMEFRYEVDDQFTIPVLLEDGSCTQCFPVYKYYKNNSGEWEMLKSNYKVYMSLKTLMSQFVLIDSPTDNIIKELQNFKQNIQAKALEDSIAPFYVGSTQDLCDSNLNSTNSDTP